ncbi:uncharacterized protein BDZ83DRAFT_60066 [Colletotrichum acutatum]|uniref:Secreted protein n=1 Tax=Glomerella acutata TaxID=27357 RepID=A0AAD8XA47_GLOAC|nr:uncharacterized protein BDZ83DRAFT_60066 [Colletotrichum acutatum]KAK1715031.1 hypothetical protein BDZ83DRAFT_60066 [Colletotrichum acutatum]
MQFRLLLLVSALVGRCSGVFGRGWPMEEGGKQLKRNDGVCGDARPRRGKLETQETSSIRTDHLAGKLSPLFGRCSHSSTPNREVPSPISCGHALVLLARLKQHEQLCALSSRLRLFGEMDGSKVAKFPEDQRGAGGWRIRSTDTS